MSNNKKNISLKTALIGSITGTIATILIVTAAITSNSVAAIADALATFFEFLAVFIAYLTLKKINKNQIHTYNYGFGKLEAISSLLIAMLMFFSLIIIFYNTVNRFAAPETISGFGIWILFFSHLIFLFINSTLYFRSKRSSKESNSTLIDSQVKLFRIKTLGNIFMISSLILGIFFTKFKFVIYVDPVISLLIASMMLFGAYNIIKKGLNDLLDKTIEENHQITILKILANNYSDYTDFHSVRSRKVGKTIFIDLYLKFDGSKLHSEIQKSINTISKSIENDIMNSNVSIISVSNT